MPTTTNSSDPQVPDEAMLQIHKELNLSYEKLNSTIKEGMQPIEGFNQAIEHFRNEFIRLKKEEYIRIERDKKAFNEMVLSKWSMTNNLKAGDSVKHADYSDEIFIVTNLSIIEGRLIVHTKGGKNGTWDNPIELVTKIN